MCVYKLKTSNYPDKDWYKFTFRSSLPVDGMFLKYETLMPQIVILARTGSERGRHNYMRANEVPRCINANYGHPHRRRRRFFSRSLGTALNFSLCPLIIRAQWRKVRETLS